MKTPDAKRRILRSGKTLWNLADALKAGSYQAFEKALGKDTLEILEEIFLSGLRGRGGAGFPTGTKTKAVHTSNTHGCSYVVCNADEGEPGTFKDRILMEEDPHLLLEGLLIASLAVRASHAYIYIRGEYGRSIERLQTAIDEARKASWLGEGIRGSSFSLDIEIMRGAGSYLCGEELTLLESLEGKRGYPRIKPPFPAEKGLWGKPTLVNNVETLANLPYIMMHGAAAYRSLGTEASPGTKLVCISGDVKNPGVYEVEMGTPLKDIIHGPGGGSREGDEICFVLLGGAAGTFASVSQLGIPLCYDALRKEGLSLGSGAIMVFGKNASLKDILQNILGFFKHESCGKCVPCRTGTYHLMQSWIGGCTNNQGERKKLLPQLVAEARNIAQTCLCPLGQSPVMPLESAMKNIIELMD